MRQPHKFHRAWPPILKPSAIDELLARKTIGEMTADEYLILARQAQTALDDSDRIRREIRDGLATSRLAARRIKRSA